ncbi:resolvase [Streptomyces sp. M19]
MVQTLAAAGELQRDLQRELTYDGLRATEAKGNKGGRRPAIAADKTDDVRAAYLGGQSIASLARENDVSRGVIRTAVADLLPEYTVVDQDVAAPELPVLLNIPGKVADFLRAGGLEPVERAAFDQGVTVRRGQGYTLRVSATPRSTASSLPAASPSTVPQASWRSRHSARPAASTRTASTPSGTLPSRDRSAPKATGRILVPWCLA